MEKKIKNCLYCNDDFPNKSILHIDDPENYSTELVDVYVIDRKLKIEAVDNYFFYLDEKVKINYCPMCGRKLIGDKK